MRKGYELRMRRPLRKGLLALFAVALLVLAGVLIYRAGYRAGTNLSQQDRAELSALKTQAVYLSERNQTLTDLAARLGRSAEIDRAAAQRVQRSLNDMEAQLTSLNEELAFYRSIMSPSDQSAGLQLQRLQLARVTPAGRAYTFNIVLTQLQRGGGLAQGRVTARIQGLRGGKPETLDMGKLAQLRLVFSFRYFQDFEGSFELPTGFAPRTIEIVVRPSSRRLKEIRKTFTWADALKGG
ncbi:DUF6776 family protein [Acidihalobacter ferrooxydans]|uniref:Uncharacterized protein n=1 Tax=Acidihalobacter ferrooxydans TaxID=1765967 RepID=A0A1P8UDQ3_9GAMM|nr:DUF6776 family protein [Acidihalobacter ferrooxydans]APZ41894.1 hypothetical protein BW247_01260 [Acidihalobacter ferrooxydans]